MTDIFDFHEEDEGQVFFDYSDEGAENAFSAAIKVIGAGGGGGNAVDTMYRDNISGVEFMVANTDAQALRASSVPSKLQIGRERTKGLGAGGKPEVGKAAALEDEDMVREQLKGADMVFVTAGMGGGTGTGAAPVLAAIAKEMGALTVGVVTKPFTFEGRRRMSNAEMGLTEFRKSVDTLIIIPNQQLLSFVPKNTPAPKAFAIADNVLCKAVKGISELITSPGLINLDFADVRTVMSAQGLALMGVGSGHGDSRALDAAQDAVNSPLLEDSSIDGAQGILINITGSEELTLHEINEAANYITEAADPEAEIFFGAVFDNSMGDNVQVTVIATGFASIADVGTHKEEYRRPERKLAPPRVKDLRTKISSRFSVLEGGGEELYPAERSSDKREPTLKTVNGDMTGFEEDLEIPTFLRKHVD